DESSEAGGIGYTYFLVSNEPNIDSAHTTDQRFVYPSTCGEAFPAEYEYDPPGPSEDDPADQEGGPSDTEAVSPSDATGDSPGDTRSKIRLTGVSIISLKNTSPRAMKVRWKKNRQASGYQLQYSRDKRFTRKVTTVRIRKAGIRSKTIKKLKKRKTYYVRIRAYKSAGRFTAYSPWSKRKKVKIKK
ncbi:MAG: fibronectin type III domain-containing protein, partial [Eubacterium sp.]|nr:fibronectin type III domain-containing protein [Eubacterium sp.]